MAKTRMQPDTAVRTESPITSAAMKQFYSENAGPLLPTLLKQGLDAFTRSFVDLYRTKPGQFNGARLLPEHLVPTFRDYFRHHVQYFELAKLVHEENGGGPIVKTNIGWLMQCVSQKPQFASLEKSTVLDEDQMIIICSAIPTSKEKKVSSPEILSEMFGESDEDQEQVNTKPAKSTGRQTTPERRQVLDIIKQTLLSIVENSEGPEDNICPSNPQMRKIIADSSPEMKTWMATEGNEHWVSKHLSLNAQKLNLRSPRAVELEQKRLGKEATQVSNPEPTPTAVETEGKTKVSKPRASKPKSEEQSKCLVVINELQGNPKHYSINEMVIEILKVYPELTEWIEDKANRKWVRVTIGNIKYDQTHNPDGTSKSPQAEPKKVEPAADKPKPIEVNLVKDGVGSPTDNSDILKRMEKFDEDMKSGIVPPIEILRTGASLVLEITDHRVEVENYRFKLTQLENSINERLEGYKKLGIEL